jgi:protein TonB
MPETPKSQVSPPPVKEKQVPKPVQVAQPNNKQASAEPLNIQKSAADKSSREETSGSMQSKEPAASEGANTSTQSAPKLVKSPKPRYPSDSIRRRQEGRVVVNIEVLENGSIGQATIAQSSGFPGLDESALDAVKNWQYTNGSGSGELVKQWVRVSIIFELKNR